MAWYTVRHLCGHEEQVQLYGTNVHGERDRQADRLSQRLCPACRVAHNEKRCEEWESEHACTPIEGSRAQVSWARCIRMDMCRACELELPDAAAHEAVENISSIADSRWLIDNRNLPAAALADAAKRANKVFHCVPEYQSER